MAKLITDHSISINQILFPENYEDTVCPNMWKPREIEFSDGHESLKIFPPELLQQLKEFCQNQKTRDLDWTPGFSAVPDYTVKTYKGQFTRYLCARTGEELDAARFRYGNPDQKNRRDQRQLIVVKQRDGNGFNGGKAAIILSMTERGEKGSLPTAGRHYWEIWSPDQKNIKFAVRKTFSPWSDNLRMVPTVVEGGEDSESAHSSGSDSWYTDSSQPKIPPLEYSFDQTSSHHLGRHSERHSSLVVTLRLGSFRSSVAALILDSAPAKTASSVIIGGSTYAGEVVKSGVTGTHEPGRQIKTPSVSSLDSDQPLSRIRPLPSAQRIRLESPARSLIQRASIKSERFSPAPSRNRLDISTASDLSTTLVRESQISNKSYHTAPNIHDPTFGTMTMPFPIVHGSEDNTPNEVYFVFKATTNGPILRKRAYAEVKNAKRLFAQARSAGIANSSTDTLSVQLGRDRPRIIMTDDHQDYFDIVQDLQERAGDGDFEVVVMPEFRA